MNYYAIPDFLAVGIVVLVAYALRRLEHQTRFRYWWIGWLLLLAHTVLRIANIQNGRWQLAQDTASMLAISLSSVVFIGAAATVPGKKMRLLLIAAIPNLLYLVYWNLSVSSHAVYYVLTAAGCLCALWAAQQAYFMHQRYPFAIYLCIGGVYGVQALLIHFAPLDFSGQWLLCWPFLLVAYLFWSHTPTVTLGSVVTSASFFLWAMVFPLAQYLYQYVPSIHIESEVWNLPKFLAASGMLLTLVEEQMTRMKDLAMRDDLTGLPNRRSYMQHFQQALERSRRNGAQVALLLVDLDRFKLVNDSVGHRGGDEMLQEVAARFLSSLHRKDVLARIGGDEFAILLEGAPRGAVEEMIGTLHHSLARPIRIRGQIKVVSASIGAAFYPDDGDNPDTLYALADMNMYRMKELSRAALPIPAYPAPL